MSDNPFEDELDENDIGIFNEISSEKKNTTPESNVSAQNFSQTSPSSATLSSDKKARYEALKKRESELIRKQQELDETNISIINSNNWPNFFPILHYNPSTDLDPPAQDCVKKNLIGLCLFSASIIFNLLSVCLVSGLKNYSHTRNLIFAIIQGIAGIYFAQTFSYEKLYQACQNKDIPFSWTLYQTILIGWMIYLILGFPNSGSVGFATFLDLVSKSHSIASMIFAFLNLSIIVAACVYETLSLMSAQKYQKVSGIPLNNLQSSVESTVEQALSPLMKESF